MGVRGKIEAVIYAAEEPVTLAQMAVLFGAEALAEQAAAGVERVAAPIEGDDGDGPEVDAIPAQDAADAIAIKLGDQEADRRASRLRDRLAQAAVRAVVETLMRDYESPERGMELREVAGGYRIATKPEYHDAVRGFARNLKPPMKLSLQALETLAVVAYKQPVTAPEISEVRGVDSGGVIGSLIGRKLVTTAGRKQVVGRPILYKTTKEFLLRFGLKDLTELPSMEEFEKMAGELENLSAEAPMEGTPLPGSKPRHAPLAIEVAREDEPAPGFSVDKSGRPIPDAPAVPLDA